MKSRTARAASERTSFVQILADRAEEMPDQDAFLFLPDQGLHGPWLTYAELDRRARAIAVELRARRATGERVLLLYPPGLDFIAAFFGCQYAGVVAVPAYPPRRNRPDSRLTAILQDCAPRLVLAASSLVEKRPSLAGHNPDLQGVEWLATDLISGELAGEWRDPGITRDTLAFLQYTSGSTSSPKGVMVSHGNLLHNEETIRLAFAQSAASVVVGWLPLYHDMGLIGNVLQPLYVGAPCVLMSPLSFLQKPLRWLEAISRYRGTTSGGPSFAYDLCVRKIREEERAGLDLSCWTLAFNGAEPVRAGTLERFASAFAPCGFRREAFYPCYGLAEATLFVSGGRAGAAPVIGSFAPADLERNQVGEVAPSDPLRRSLVSCGSAWAGNRIRVVDPETLVPLAENRVGEIWVGGPSVAQGYWNRAEETERLFRARLDGEPDLFLRTGDLGFLAGGELFITGRLKDLIILRGRNLYPQDIERTAEESHRALRPGCGVAFAHEVGDEERLVVVQEADHRLDVPFAAVAAGVARAVAEEHQVQVDRLVLLRAGGLPKTTSGKVQRQACRKAWLAGELAVLWEGAPGGEAAPDLPGPPASGLDPEALVAASPAERRRAALLRDLRLRIAGILRVAPEWLEPGRPLAEAGLDSLRAVEIKMLLEEDFGCVLDLANLQQLGSLDALVEQVLRAHTAGGGALRVDPGGEQAEHPLSWGQSSLWFLHRLSPESAAYNIAAALRLGGVVDIVALGRAFRALVARHPALRSTVFEEHGQPRARVHPAGAVLAVEDATAWSEQELRDRLDDEAHRPFALDRGPLLRAHLFVGPGRERVLLVVVHHVAVDFWSLDLAAEELGVLYTAFAAGEGASPLPPVRYVYSDFSRWQDVLLAGAAGERSWSYWRERLGTEIPELQLPEDRPRALTPSFRGAAIHATVSPGLRARLQEVGRREGATLFTVLLTAFQALLLRHGAAQDLAVGTPASGRTSSAFGEVIGYFVNPVVLRGDLSGDPGFGPMVRRTRQVVLEGMEHQDYPFALLTEKLQAHRGAGRPPLFEVLFGFYQRGRSGRDSLAGLALRRPGVKLELGGLSLESIGLAQRTTFFDLTLSAAEIGGGLELSLEYNTDRFDESTAVRLADRLGILLSGAAAAPEARLSELPLLGDAERHQVLQEWSGAAALEPAVAPCCLQERFFAQARRTPERVALVWGESRWSYAALAAQVALLARSLATLGVGPELPVGVLQERTPEMVVAMLGILTAGGAYLPLDPAYPPQRLALMLADAGADLVLTRRSLASRLDGLPVRALCLDDVWPAPGRIAATPGAGSLAYLIYTSGSTGRPKGVAIEHRSTAALLDWAREAFSPEELSGVLAATSISFDLSVFELFAPLTSGGTVILASDALALRSLPAVGEVRLINTVPSALAALLRDGALPLSVQTVSLAGERLHGELVQEIYRQSRTERVLNLYGPSEDTTYSTGCKVGRDEPDEPGIGRPLAGSRSYVLDGTLVPLPPGAMGELYLAGRGLARGYLGQPELTAERFVPEPFSGIPGARMYRTGDLVRRRRDGSLGFLGRADHQVKVRGFRIELGEVEVLLERHPAVREAVAGVTDNGPAERRLVAWVAPRTPGEPLAARLRDHLRSLLPDYMVPSLFRELEALPRLPNGKVDRKALPEPEHSRTAVGRMSPHTATEELLAMIWCEVLGIAAVGLDESFFDLGGHSLLATQVISRLRETFGVEIPLRNLFNAPTVADLAVLVEQAVRDVAPERVLPLVRVSRSGLVPLSFAQQRLWFLDQWQPGGSTYNMPGALRIRGRLRREVLEWALAEIVHRHESLRTTFVAYGGEPAQVVHPPVPQTISLVDLTTLPATLHEAEARRLSAEEARLGFDLERGPLWRLTLLRSRRDDHVLLATMHHIVSDAWSMSILARELGMLYRAGSEGIPSPLGELPVQYADFTVWQKQWLSGARLEAELEHWHGRLAGAPPLLELPTDRPRPAVQSYRGESRGFELSERLAGALEVLGRRERATAFMVLLAAFQALLARSTGREDVSVGSPIAGRNRLEIEGIIGFFVNTLVLRTDLSGDPSFRELLTRVRAMALEAHAHQDLPFEKLVDELAPERSLAHSPLVQVMFVLQNAPLEKPDLPEMESSLLPTESGTAKLDLLFELSQVPAGLRGRIEYATDLFDATTVLRFAEHFTTLLGAALASPGLRLSELPLLSAAEEHQLVLGWNDTASPRQTVSLDGLFAAQVERSPEALALVADEVSWTYRELSRRVNQLARRLRRLGVGPEVRAAVCLERSPELVLALYGILKAGGAYVPLDPEYPRERLAFMLSDAHPAVLLSSETLRDRLPETGVPTVWLDWDAAALEVESDGELASGIVHDLQLAYMIYTSGSTGRPKGAMVSHRSICNRLLWMQDAYSLTSSDAILQKTPFSFDVSVWELFWPLLVGARLVIARPGGHRDAAYLADVIAREEVSILHFVPSMLQPFLDEPGLDRCRSLRKVVVSGEALGADLERRFFERLPVDLENLYGPTEAAVDVTVWGCRPGDVRVPVPIGRPIGNTTIYVLDPGGRPVPIGVPGELAIGGANVGRGYLGQPALTAEKFVPDPFGAPGSRRYRTGDLVRHAADGAVEFLGRLDHQVKIRGFRIELGEIEAALARHPGVREAVVLAREHAPGDRCLVGYVTTRPGLSPTAAELRGFLREELPEHMLPAAVVALSELPRTLNGKLDRRALPAPEGSRIAAGMIAPRTITEQLLAMIWCEVLGVREVGVEESFFELGGHSLLATQVVSRMRRVCGVELPVRALFEAPTLAELARRVDAAKRAGDLPQAPPLLPVARDIELPLSFAQQRLWFLEQWEPGRPVYNLPGALRLHGPLRVEVLEWAVAEIVRRHESLRTTFCEVDGEPAQVIHPDVPRLLPVVDLAALPDAVGEAETAHLAVQEARRGFDLERGPLFRRTLVRLREGDHALLTTMHHIVSDAWSMSILIRELGAIYRAGLAGVPTPFSELPVQYADFAAWQRRWLGRSRLDAEMEYWRGQLAGAPAVLELPADRPRPAVQRFRGDRQVSDLSERLAASVEALGRRERATPFMVLLAAFQALLARLTGWEDVSVGSPIAGRNRLEIEGLIGFFVNTLVLRTDLSGDPSYRELLARVRTMALEAHAHQDLPFEKLVDELAPERSLSHSPLIQVVFSLHNASLEVPDLPGVESSLLPSGSGTAKFDLVLELSRASGGLHGVIEYATDLFDATTVVRFAEHFTTLLAGALASPGLRLSELPLLSAAEAHQLVLGWNDTACPRPIASLDGLFAAQVERSPEAVAVVAEEVSWTYRELSRRVNQLARRLRRLGVGPEVRVAVCLERSPELVLALYGILKAGGAYVPLDPDYPRERLAFMLADARPAVLLSSEPLRDRLPEHGVPTVWLDREAVALQAASGEELAGGLVDDLQLAYMIYTSGSTGRPKGAMVSHRGICNRLLWMQDAYRLTPADVVLQKTPFSFDVSVWELFWPLLTGARLVVARPGGHRDGPYQVDVIAREKVSVVHFVPSMLRAFLDEPDLDRCRSLRKVVVSGEALGADLERRVFERLPVELENLYGPTEASVDVTVWGCRPGAARAAVPIGRPITNTAIYVLDPGGRPVPVGVAGELYIGGVNVGRGYLDRPALTAEKFVPDPSGAPGSRLYRTGDLVRHAPDGAIEFLGRLDHQVKIRGFRIELGEIEVALARHPGVREAVVVVREDAPGDRRLVGYVTAGAELSATAAELRGFLREELPDHMVPSAVVFLPELPLTPNGKLDRRALPEPERSAPREGRGEGPRTPIEETLAAIWGEVLGIDRISTDDNFFELGGHSLLGMQVVSRARRMLGVEISIRHLFESPTLAGLAAECERSRRGEKADAPRLAPTPLSSAQQRLWHLDRLAPGRPVDHLSAALRLDGPLRREVLEQALSEIVRRHEILRTTFVSVAGQPVQEVGPPAARSIPLIDLAGLAESGPAEARRREREEASRPFDLERGPLLRMTLLRLGEQDHMILVNLHRIVSDDWSMRLLVHELTLLREAFAAGLPSPLPAPPVQYADYARWQSGWLRGEASASQLAFWKRRLADPPPPLRMTTHRPRPEIRSFRGGSRPLALLPDLGRAVRALGHQEGGTPFTVLLAAWQILLRQHTGQEVFLLGTPTAGRHHPGNQNAIGCFADLLPLRADLSGNPTFQELLRRVQETVVEAQAHQDLPFDRLIEELRLDRDPGDHPLVQVAFSWTGASPGQPVPPPTPFGLDREMTEFDLALSLADEGEGFAGSLQHRIDLLDAPSVARMHDHYVLVLAHAVSRPASTLAELTEILAEADTQQRIAQQRARREELRPQLAGARRQARVSERAR